QRSPAATEIVSVPFGASVAVLLLIEAMRHVPLSAPVAASAISTQWPAKYPGMFAVRSVTRVAPPLPDCATPLPRDGNCVASPAWPSLLTVRSPYVALGPLT